MSGALPCTIWHRCHIFLLLACKLMHLGIVEIGSPDARSVGQLQLQAMAQGKTTATLHRSFGLNEVYLLTYTLLAIPGARFPRSFPVCTSCWHQGSSWRLGMFTSHSAMRTLRNSAVDFADIGFGLPWLGWGASVFWSHPVVLCKAGRQRHRPPKA